MPLPTGWTEAYEGGGLATNDHPVLGGIIDQAIVSRKWFVIFAADIPMVEDLPTREAAFEAHRKATETR